MNIPFARKAFLAVLIAMPVSAGAEAVSGETAKAAVAAAADRADRNIAELKQVPREFAAILVGAPYGNEKGIPLGTDDTIDDIKAMLKAKADYWGSVGRVLEAEKARIDGAISELRPDEVELLASMGKESVALGRSLRAVEAVRADVAKDIALVDDITSSDAERRDAREKDESIIARKSSVFNELRSLNAAQSGFFRQTVSGMDVLNLLPVPVMHYSMARFQTSAEKEREHDSKIEQLQLEPVSSTIRRLGRIIQQPNDKN